MIIDQQLSCSIFWHTQVALTALTTDSCKDQTKNLTDFNVLVCFVIQLQLLQYRKCLLLNCNEELFWNHGVNLENYLLPYEPYDVNIDNTYISIIPFKFFLVDTGIEPMASNLNLEVKYCNRIDLFIF